MTELETTAELLRRLTTERNEAVAERERLLMALDQCEADAEKWRASFSDAQTTLAAIKAGVEALADEWAQSRDPHKSLFQQGWTQAERSGSYALRALLAANEAPRSPADARGDVPGSTDTTDAPNEPQKPYSDGCGSLTHPDRKAHRFGDPFGCYCECVDDDGCDHADRKWGDHV